MNLNNASDLRLGGRQLNAVYLGDKLIWSRKPPAPELPSYLARITAIRSKSMYATLAFDDILCRKNTRVDVTAEYGTDAEKITNDRMCCLCVLVFSRTTNGREINYGFGAGVSYDANYQTATEARALIMTHHDTYAGARITNDKIRLRQKMTVSVQMADFPYATVTYEGDAEPSVRLEMPSHIDIGLGNPNNQFNKKILFGEAGYPIGDATVYEIRVYEGDVLTHHLIPVRNIAGGDLYGFFDTVKRKEYYVDRNMFEAVGDVVLPPDDDTVSNLLMRDGKAFATKDGLLFVAAEQE